MLSVVLAALFSLLVAVPSASGTRVPPRPDRVMPKFTHAQAKAVLARAERQLRRDSARLRGRRPVGSTASTDLTMTLRDLFLARTVLRGGERERADAVLARPTDQNGDSDVGVSYGARTDNYHCFATACIHWVATDNRAGDGINDAVSTTDADHDSIPDYVETVAATVEHVLAYEHGTLGYRLPLSDQGASAPHNPDGKIDIYLADLGPRGLYGYCSPDDAFSGRRVPGYCVLDNNYSRAEYGTSNYLNPLRATAAHELFHAVQFGYDDAEDLWFMEGTATWVEDEVYDAINDNLQYLAYSPMRFPADPLDLSIDPHQYGSWIFFKYASERYGAPVVRRMWELADAGAPQPRYSLQAIRAAVSAHSSWTPFFALFAAWNTRQPHGYSEASRYPAPAWAGTRVLSKKRKTTGWLSINLPHLSSGPLKVVPAAKLKPGKHLRIDANLPPTTRGSAVLVQRRFKNGVVANSLMRLNSQGDGHARIGFNRKYLAYVAVIPTNTSTAMTGCQRPGSVYGYPYSCLGRGYYDAHQVYAVRATVG